MKRVMCAVLVCACLLGGCISIEFEDPVESSDEAISGASSEAVSSETESTPPAESKDAVSSKPKPVSSKAESVNDATQEEPTVPIEDQIDVRMIPLDEAEWRGVGLLIKNNSDKTIGSLEIQLLFYNTSGDIVSAESNWHDLVLPCSTVVSYITAPDEYESCNYKLDIDVDTYGGKNYAKDIGVKTNTGDECIIIQLTNGSKFDLGTIKYAVVFYKDGQIVDVTNSIEVSDIEKGETAIEKCETWGIDFDTYEVYINEATVI